MHIDLVPFSPCAAVQHLGYELLLEQGPSLRLSVQLKGSIATTFGESVQVGQRQVGLWQHHCFELFIGEPGASAYREFNLAPNGHWNCFEFSDYRMGQQESDDCALAAVRAACSGQTYRLEANIRLNPRLTVSGLSLRLGAAAVIKTADQLNYFSISHGVIPDFHDRNHHIQWALQ